jgi:hypothetical protein
VEDVGVVGCDLNPHADSPPSASSSKSSSFGSCSILFLRTVVCLSLATSGKSISWYIRSFVLPCFRNRKYLVSVPAPIEIICFFCVRFPFPSVSFELLRNRSTSRSIAVVRQYVPAKHKISLHSHLPPRLLNWTLALHLVHNHSLLPDLLRSVLLLVNHTSINNRHPPNPLPPPSTSIINKTPRKLILQIPQFNST